MISPGQVKKIHALKGRLGLSDAEYRAFLMERGDGFASSCKDLSHEEAGRLIDELEQEAVRRGVWQKRGAQPAFENLGDRPDKATPKQLRMIAGMWSRVARVQEAKARAAALDRFVHRICGCERLIWLDRGDVQKVVRAIEAMKRKELNDA